MWKLKISEGERNPWLSTVNNHVGRQVWEYDPNLGTPEDLMEVEKARESFKNHRFERKHSSDLLMRLQ
ncbi:Cycloartenol synthase, partial [Thalictrum thalictroides]